jgi:hypothetical protein
MSGCSTFCTVAKGRVAATEINMSKVQSGAVLIGIAVLVNVVGRILQAAMHGGQNVGSAGFLAIVLTASVVVGLFGLFRIISGLLAKKS